MGVGEKIIDKNQEFGFVKYGLSLRYQIHGASQGTWSMKEREWAYRNKYQSLHLYHGFETPGNE